MDARALMSRESIWPGYAAWRETVLESRREFVRVARSFWLIPEIIPARSRDDIALLYRFCRQLDDAVDEAASLDDARAAIRQQRDELAGRIEPRPHVAAFLAGARRSGLPLECAGFLLEGMESDLGPVRIADDRALLQYSYRVSSAVGLMLAPLLGVQPGEAEARVIDLGLALQVSNILLGVAEDARRDRVYLPAARLAEAGLAPEDVLRSPRTPRLLPVLHGLAALGDRYYQSAQDGAALLPLRYRHGVLLLASVYRDLGWQAARGERVPAGVPLRARLHGSAALLQTALRPRTLGLIKTPPHDPALHQPIRDLPSAHQDTARSSS